MIDGIPFVDFTPPALLGFVFLLVIFGKLVPISQIKAERAEHSKVQTENAATIKAQDIKIQVLLSNQVKLVNAVGTTQQVIEALPRPSVVQLEDAGGT